MSYSYDLKESLAEKEIKKACCRTSMLYGMLAAGATVSPSGEILLGLPKGAVSAFAERQIRILFGKAPTLSPYGIGKRHVRLSFFGKGVAEFLSSDLSAVPLQGRPCALCHAHFLRGVFLSAGRMSDFRKLCRLEFSFKERRDKLFLLLSEAAGEPKYTKRREEELLYYKTATAIGDFFAAIGAENITFSLINNTIEAEYRNDANRRANCETRNIARSIEASMRFLHLYRLLEAEGKLSLLPEELQETARLRAENPDMPLSVLGGKMTPPVSKSGLSHRLNKIIKSAVVLLGEDGVWEE